MGGEVVDHELAHGRARLVRGARYVGLEHHVVEGEERFGHARLVGVDVQSRAGDPVLLERVQEVERAFHRVREVRWGPRTLDVDVIAYDGLVRTDPELTLPHPRAHERAFVLRPWHDLEPDAVFPELGPIADLLESADSSGVRKREDLTLEVE